MLSEHVAVVLVSSFRPSICRSLNRSLLRFSQTKHIGLDRVPFCSKDWIDGGIWFYDGQVDQNHMVFFIL